MYVETKLNENNSKYGDDIADTACSEVMEDVLGDEKLYLKGMPIIGMAIILRCRLSTELSDNEFTQNGQPGGYSAKLN